MKFYVPEIGDDIVLTEDWSFSLFPESRNNDLAALQGYYLHSGRDGSGKSFEGWVSEHEVSHLRDPDYNVVYPPIDNFRVTGLKSVLSRGSYDHAAWYQAREEAEKNNTEFAKYWADHKIWQEECDKKYKPVLAITLPKGTHLKVDRIYVRKGSSDFSSITFFAKNLGEVMVRTGWSWHNKKMKKKKSLRFWAKLVDCNTINFEPLKKE